MFQLSFEGVINSGRIRILAGAIAGIFIAVVQHVWIAAAGDSAARKEILFLGDSLSAGYGIDPDSAFPALIQQKLDAASLPFEVVSAGLSGDTTAGGLRRLPWLLKRRVSILVLELGGNDGLRGFPLSTTRANLQQIVNLTKDRYPDVRLVIAGMRMPENLGAEYAGSFRSIFPDLAKLNHAALIPFLLEGVAGDPRFNQGDLIHPNVAGHKIVADNVWRVLEPVIREVVGEKSNRPAASNEKVSSAHHDEAVPAKVEVNR